MYWNNKYQLQAFHNLLININMRCIEMLHRESEEESGSVD